MSRRGAQDDFVSAVVLAAGSSRRLGHLKQLSVVGDRPLLERTLGTVRRSSVDEVILVLGHKAKEIQRRMMDLSGLLVVVNRSHRRGMSSSIQVGLAAVSARSSAALIVLADQPFLSVSLIDGIVASFRRSHPQIVAPVFRGVQGNPVLIARKLFSEVSGISGDVGAKSLLERHRNSVFEYPANKAELLIDVDTPADLAMARSLLKRRRTSARRRVGAQSETKLPIAKEKPGRS